VARQPSATSQGEPPAWLVYAPLRPLLPLILSGLYLLVLPYGMRSRSR